ncbi:SDR family NAD(P)-dependent oxidoreductase [Staphylococcus epidermidis]|uniref:SDR family NAD(P)-dependent oxidoreductase n=1 Tax=Staphylococcus epidermidis TaxID=1282 RepID=UPI00209227E4|nr:SDR family NAD(P)-dependent oxidoreductase [Staphylococcus epidermidis]MCG2218414.1 SDR family NAD(P)-dependent oxidoreductase [Staphylococcus epidermidis]MCO6290555.1 SDR family NAD(P)-dependent oxidoreductase [Staphylococcus epidermidis]
MEEKTLILDINSIIEEKDTVLLINKNIEIITRNYNNINEKYRIYSNEVIHRLKEFIYKKKDADKFFQLVILSQNEEILDGITSLLKTVSQEINNFQFQVLHITDVKNSGDIINIINSEKSEKTEQEIKYSNNVRYVKKLKKLKKIKYKRDIWKEQGTYIITGGSGELSYNFSKEILERTNSANIILVGRRPLDKIKNSDFREFINNNQNIEYIPSDVSDNIMIQKLINYVMKKYKTITGIIHSAGIINDNLFLNKDQNQIDKVLEPKVQGTYFLDEATKSIDLDFIVLFSSGASDLGNIGQSDYSLANSFLNQFASYRNNLVKKGLRFGKTLSISWPLWEEGGMNVNEDVKEIMYSNIGMRPIRNHEGLEIFYESMNQKSSHIIAMNGDLNKFNSNFIHESDKKYTKDDVDIKYTKDNVEDSVKKIISDITQLERDDIDIKESLNSYGINSVQLTKISNKLIQKFPSTNNTLVYQVKNIEELINGIKKNNNITTKNSKEVSNRINIDKSGDNHLNDNSEISIIGMSARFNDYQNIKEFESALKKKHSTVYDILEERDWDRNLFVNYDTYKNLSKRDSLNKVYNKWGYLMKNAYNFDNNFFNIKKEEAEKIDPQERIFLEESWKAITDAGYSKEKLKNYKVGVFGAITQNGFSEWKTENRTSFSGMVNRLSNFMNLDGPSIAIDTMCSSSLVALNQAIHYIKSNEIDIAVVGGVNLYLHPSNYINLCQNSMISTDSENKVLSRNSNGFMPSEGVGVVILKKTTLAKKDFDTILAGIKASKVKHSGETAAFNIPSSKQQISVMKETLKESNLSLKDIDHLELSVNGNKIADDIEIESVTSLKEKELNLSVGSLKSIIGNSEAVSGIAQLIKSVLELINQEVYPSKINDSDYFNKKGLIFDNNLISEKRINYIGINSFGAGGTYSHLILERNKQEYKSLNNEENLDALIFSSKTEKSLRNLVASWRDVIKSDNNMSLKEIIDILIYKREEFPIRLAIKENKKENVIKTIDDFLNDYENKNVYYSKYEQKSEGRDQRLISWVKGGRINKKSTEVKNINFLPTYEFDKKNENEETSVDISYMFENNTEKSNRFDRKTLKICDEKEIENCIEQIINELINKEYSQKIKRDASFYSIGIDSILVEQFVDNINKKFSLNINVATIFNYSSIQKLAQYIYDEYMKEK